MKLKNLERVLFDENSQSVYRAKLGRKDITITFSHNTHLTLVFHNARQIANGTWDSSVDFEEWLNDLIASAEGDLR